MLDWIKFIGEFILERITSIGDMITMFSDGIVLFRTSFSAAPDFLAPILTLTLSVAVLMWVVNIF